MKTTGLHAWAYLVACVIGGVALLPAHAQAPVEPVSAFGFEPKPAVTAQHAIAVTANAHATDAALAILREGGTAADAAIAAALVLNVVEPQFSGIGGGGFLLHFDARRARVSAWDGRETAPMAVDERLFLNVDGEKMAFYDAVVGGRSVGVPGLLRMFEQVHARHGRLSWTRLFAPAIRLAEDGFAVSPLLSALAARDRYLAHDPAARALFFDATGRALAVGTTLRNPQLAGVLRRVADEGVGAFYGGDIARDLVAAVNAAPNPGALSLNDLASYRALERATLCAGYRAHRVCGMPPPSSGGATVLAMLGMLERFRLAEIAPDSAFAAHLFSEAGRLAFADRDAWYGDPDAMTVRPDRLLDRAYLAGRAGQIRLSGSLGRAAPGTPAQGAVRPVTRLSAELPATTHLSVIDAEGNAVSLTASIEDTFGSRRMVRGFLLNNQLTDFSFAGTDERGPHPNHVGPRKRPRSSMAPTLVFDPTGRLFAVTGSPGGSQIINYVAESLVGLIDWKLPPDRLLVRPHAGSRNGPTEVEDSPDGRALAVRLTAFGHEPVMRELPSGLSVIVRDGSGWTGAADPRREGVAAGY
ncbi:gamma-glutamyltransferase family protein [Aromatoleum diolicum]|uniref:Gamma-glutamyltransferase n=1 Tax=Aromatoleum diolicum TaxID=75796 RepID=A0ABX1Q892_9RHOO|nr:gamma-glutamyltransferase family protein [Aromatoleum diolicum]NMG74508.1 gamma-glutamyltransferase [Aromatoleum diolicum]